MKTIVVVVLAGGILVLAYGGFGAPRDSTEVKLGSTEWSSKEVPRVNPPPWAGEAAVVAGGPMTVVGARRP